MIAEQIPAVQQLTLEEKWLLANELWDEVNEHQQKLPTSPEIMALVEERLTEYERGPQHSNESGRVQTAVPSAVKSYGIVLLQGAQRDLLSIYATRGEWMYLQVDKALGILRVFPEAGPVNFAQRIRRLVVTKTHLGIFYSITGNRVLVIAVLDLRQSSRAIQKRLRESSGS